MLSTHTKESKSNVSSETKQKKKHFLPLPLKLAIDTSLKSSDVLIYAYLAYRCKKKNNKCWPGLRTIGEDIGLSHECVSRHVKSLEKTGYLVVDRDIDKEHNKRSNRYYLVPFDEVEKGITEYEGYHPTDFDRPTNPATNNRFFQLPLGLFGGKTPKSVIFVYAYIRALAGNKDRGYCNPHQKTVARDLNISEKTVRRAINYLKEISLITIAYKREGNVYYINYEEEMAKLPVPKQKKNKGSDKNFESKPVNPYVRSERTRKLTELNKDKNSNEFSSKDNRNNNSDASGNRKRSDSDFLAQIVEDASKRTKDSRKKKVDRLAKKSQISVSDLYTIWREAHTERNEKVKSSSGYAAKNLFTCNAWSVKQKSKAKHFIKNFLETHGGVSDLSDFIYWVVANWNRILDNDLTWVDNLKRSQLANPSIDFVIGFFGPLSNIYHTVSYEDERRAMSRRDRLVEDMIRYRGFSREEAEIHADDKIEHDRDIEARRDRFGEWYRQAHKQRKEASSFLEMAEQKQRRANRLITEREREIYEALGIDQSLPLNKQQKLFETLSSRIRREREAEKRGSEGSNKDTAGGAAEATQDKNADSATPIPAGEQKTPERPPHVSEEATWCEHWGQWIEPIHAPELPDYENVFKHTQGGGSGEDK